MWLALESLVALGVEDDGVSYHSEGFVSGRHNSKEVAAPRFELESKLAQQQESRWYCESNCSYFLEAVVRSVGRASHRPL